MDILIIISDFLISGFIFTIGLLFIGYLFMTAHRPTFLKLISISDKFLLVGSIIYIIIQVGNHLFYALDPMYKQALFGLYWFALWGPIFFKGLLPQILWIKKLRTPWISIMLLPFLFAESFVPLLMSYFNSAYLPSNWSYELNYLQLSLVAILYLGILMVVFWWTEKRRV
jgi:hypothetical protein